MYVIIIINSFVTACHLRDDMKNGKKYFAFCRLLRRQISYGSYKKKDKGLNDNKMAAIYILLIYV